MATDGMLAQPDAITVTDDGTALVVYDPSCLTFCCGAVCARLRRYVRCSIQPDGQGCQPDGPPHVWVCEDLRCEGQAPGGSDPGSLVGLPPPVILWRNIGYVRTDAVVDAADVPPGDTIWNAIDAGVADPITGNLLFGFCYASCDDPGIAPRECPLWEEATACPGETYTGTLPRVFVAVSDGIAPPFLFAGECGTASATPIGMGGANPVCFEFRVGTRPHRGDLPPGSVVSSFLRGAQCCDCVSGCGRSVAFVPDCFIPGRGTTLSCCCSCEGEFTSQFQYRMERYYTAAGSPGGATAGPPPGPEVFVGSGTALLRKDSGCTILSNTGTRTDTYDFYNWSGQGWTPVHDGGTGEHTADEVCIDAGPGVRIPTTSGGPFVNPWTFTDPVRGIVTEDANFKCPAQVGGMRTFTWTSPDGTEVEVMRISHVGRIVRCGFIAESWGGDSVFFRNGVQLFRTVFRGSRSGNRNGAVRCTGTLGCGGSSGAGRGTPIVGSDGAFVGVIVGNGCAGCTDTSTGGAQI